VFLAFITVPCVVRFEFFFTLEEVKCVLDCKGRRVKFKEVCGMFVGDVTLINVWVLVNNSSSSSSVTVVGD
jgi:hypothetical protein